jgi:hypothetical protein
MTKRMESFFSPCVRVRFRAGKWRADRVADWKILSGLDSARGGSFPDSDYEKVLAELSEFGYALESIINLETAEHGDIVSE